ncbi:hypothetical protein BE20_57790 [Sorangium cellulosum]|uniref:CobQ/CobB/MinD/ParA nucleotide binding domain-containing protein n=1 Tax=Sorangium cellulosum TaxID=56 RepID=A0A150T5Q0_SORCE|nr:hypothetical protein BE20_57790 [Sorangium cellulosum]KYF99968.1 hypothetical protein BE18_09630 [Sorangium cellulosum]
MVTFDEVLPTLVRVCEEAPHFVTVRRCCAVRDLHGRVRLVIDPEPGAAAVDVDALALALRGALGGYFVGPIWSTATRHADEARLARAVLARPEAQPRWGATYDDPATGVRGLAARAPWRKMERRLSKQAWLEAGQPNLPWELGDGPAIVTFYSYKGGVGRTTALTACAWQLAQAGRRVAVVDLDLEAPGLGVLLEGEAGRGVVDFLADHVATGASRLDDLVAGARALGDDEERVHVLAAGRLGPMYLEKLARLDFLSADAGQGGHASTSPMELALRELLFAVRRDIAPDYILIDSRAGLHDLAGLSLHRLAHVDVIVSRASEQGYRGLDVTLGALVGRKGTTGLQCVIAQSFVPSEGLPEALFEEQEFRQRSYASFAEHVYQRAALTIAEQDPGPHVPFVLRYDAGLARFASLRAIRTSLFAPWFEELRKRVEILCVPPREDEDA